MPGIDEQPDYYAMLSDTQRRAGLPGLKSLVAADRENSLLGTVTFVGKMAAYGSGGRAPQCKDAYGIRLLAVTPSARRMGGGKSLTRACIQKTWALGYERVILHTTKAMVSAWKMYQGMGFKRSPDRDFEQGTLPVFGFSLGKARF